jgi:hypothetical protein
VVVQMLFEMDASQNFLIGTATPPGQEARYGTICVRSVSPGDNLLEDSIHSTGMLLIFTKKPIGGRFVR